MHLFLTGDVQIGKSTILRKVTRALETPVRGFQTYFVGDRTSPFRTLYMAEAGVPQEADDARIVARFLGGKPDAYPERFDAIGCALLAHARQGDGVILMDECGRLERDARLFQQAILDALDGPKPILGVVAQNGNEWTKQILAHPNVRVFTVILENRDRLPSVLLAEIRKTGQNS